MNYEEFKDYILDNIKSYLSKKDQDFDMKIKTIEGNSLKEVDALIIDRKDSDYITRIFLDKAYMAYREEGDMEPVLEDIAETLRRSGQKLKKIEAIDFESLEGVKDRLSVQVLNGNWNQDKLRAIAHRRIPETDLAVVYRIEVASNSNGLESIKVTNKMLENWGISEDQLYQAALEQNMKKYPFIITDFSQFFLMEDPVPGKFPDKMRGNEFYCLTNGNTVNGAAAILYPDLLKSIGDKFQSNYFILPSSIHEVLLLKDDGKKGVKELQEMVESVNRESVPESDVLSDHVYAYDRENDRFYQAKAWEEIRHNAGKENSDMGDRTVSCNFFESCEEESLNDEELDR